MLSTQQINMMRQFNRQYTQALGILNKHTFDMDLTYPEGRVLIEIADQAPVTPMTLSKRLGLDKSYTSRIIKQLEKKGILSKERSKQDMRSVEVQLTAHGQEIFEQVNDRSNEQMAGLLASLSADQQEKIFNDVMEMNTLLFEGNDADDMES
ncbi:MAG: MarR family transcriptional regulator [Lactobacillaceae bacterium]|nr:MarR family transcriptional regulator [Lactobacillaceae bacterium]